MQVLAKTRCGCVRVVNISAPPLPRAFRLTLWSELSLADLDDTPVTKMLEHNTREFKATGQFETLLGFGELQVYLEVRP